MSHRYVLTTVNALGTTETVCFRRKDNAIVAFNKADNQRNIYGQCPFNHIELTDKSVRKSLMTGGFNKHSAS